MVLSLPLPSFSRSTTTSPPLRSSDGNQNNANRPHRASTGSNANRHSWKSAGVLASSTGNQSTTLSEALRNNPFGSTSRSHAIVDTSAEQTEEQRREQEELNNALETLARIFPDVKVEVFRELLVRFDGLSRLQVCVEQLLRHKQEWVAGRWNVPDGTGGNEGDAAIVPPGDGDENLVPPEERFRSDEYKAAVKSVLGKEFSGLSRSTVDAVLAEVNFCYMRARPTLRDLSRKTWRATFNSIFPSFKRKKDRDDHPMLVWQRYADGGVVPRLKETGCDELNSELHGMLLAPLLRQRQDEQEERDYQLAEEMNELEAKAVDALYECECCLSDVTFEQISACSSSSHIICHSCIQRTAQEALFGQGWTKSVDIEKSTLKCLAPVSQGTCDGTLHPEIVKQAILLNKSGFETYLKFEDRLFSDVLLKSQMKLIRCPFCSYAEADPVYHPSTRGITWRFRRDGALSTILMLIFILDSIPLLIIPALIIYLLDPPALSAIFENSLRNLCLKIRPKRFTCSHPSCRRVSCITCKKPWRDPHLCHEPLLLDLRATVEAARTAAVKRTCPRCGLSFVKSSGCNKLTCVCGYSMCYLCRKALGPPLNPAAQLARRRPPRQRRARYLNQENIDPNTGAEGYNNDEGLYEEDEPEETEGYKHFCEHFRINPGSRCTECNKCDLYQAEDEEEVARRAGERAEREWRARQGMTGVEMGANTRHVNHEFSAAEGNRHGWVLHGRGKDWRYWSDDVWRDGQWKLEGQAFVDWVVESVIVIEEI
ncbi:hypothetical protein ASPWEDRAFT_116110 [Aspergillus wentii DTO 134E9]|uniref:RING-type domain-containing protein n=1 Tax=Aspergillus wentii DTO 134E9 TaxID=1073089 RepID=A0A1L9REC9_ASPWE|nr:uncharacterized protein ASPWEDRAFT_116110 [Aspergillus wentii DTO 134E9]KAI9933477.1 hypothetical protein MW887_007950 [Aspergillus wentii]OJJ33223.1 hypothetical protein ASPWEDRAFT_116110 [Aspergillus wentii DTO 134E9]